MKFLRFPNADGYYTDLSLEPAAIPDANHYSRVGKWNYPSPDTDSHLYVTAGTEDDTFNFPELYSYLAVLVSSIELWAYADSNDTAGNPYLQFMYRDNGTPATDHLLGAQHALDATPTWYSSTIEHSPDWQQPWTLDALDDNFGFRLHADTAAKVSRCYAFYMLVNCSCVSNLIVHPTSAPRRLYPNADVSLLAPSPVALSYLDDDKTFEYKAPLATASLPAEYDLSSGKLFTTFDSTVLSSPGKVLTQAKVDVPTFSSRGTMDGGYSYGDLINFTILPDPI